MANKHIISDLYQMQSLPLSAKIRMTEQRIRAWVDEYGEDGVYVSFSGGKDSTVLLHIIRNLYPEIKAVFVDTGLEYPEIREFVKSFDNVDWIKPKMNFKQVIEKYGYPFISKEVSECVDGARKYIKILTDRQTDRQTDTLCTFLQKITRSRRIQETSIGSNGTNYADKESILRNSRGGTTTSIVNSEDWENIPVRVKILFGMMTKGNIPNGERSRFSCERYKFFLDAPFEISSKCCTIMKKQPVHEYARKTGRKPITGQMAVESRLRTQKWLENGCNGFEMKSPISNPMAFWTEQDVLLYIKEYNIPIASVYGEVVIDYESEGQLDGQMDMFDLGIFDKDRRLLKTTGCDRTGCMFCGYGCHLEKSPNRFERMKETHPKQYDYIMRPTEQGGMNYKGVINWINEHGNMDIKY